MDRRQFTFALLAATSAMAITETAIAAGAAPDTALYFTMALKGGQFLEETARTGFEKAGDPRLHRFSRAEVIEQVNLSDKLNRTTAAQGIETVGAPGLLGPTAPAPGIIGAVGAVATAPLAVAGGVVGGTASAFGLRGAPMTSDAQKAQMVTALQGMPPGPQYDAAFVNAQLMGHREAFEIHSTYAQTGADPALRRIARGALPLIRLHISQLTRFQAEMGGPQG